MSVFYSHSRSTKVFVFLKAYVCVLTGLNLSERITRSVHLTEICVFSCLYMFFFFFSVVVFFWYIFSLARVCVCVQVVSVNTRAGSVCTRKKTKAEASERCLNDIPKLGFKVGSALSFSLLSSLFFSYSLSRLSVCLILIFDYFLFFPGR